MSEAMRWWIVEFWNPETERNETDYVEAHSWLWARLLFLARHKRQEPPIVGIREVANG